MRLVYLSMFLNSTLGGRDILTGNGGADIFVAQEVTAEEFVNAGRVNLATFIDEVTDFKVGEDKIGITNFGKIRELAVDNNYDFDEARRLYFEDVKKRAEKTSKGEVAIVLEDLDYYFQKLTPLKEFKRDTDGHQQFWSLVDNRGEKRPSALMMFHSDAFSSDLGNDHPFSSVDLKASEVFEFL